MSEQGEKRDANEVIPSEPSLQPRTKTALRSLRDANEGLPSELPPRPRIGVGLLAAFLLHQTILSVGSALTALIEGATGFSDAFHNSPVSLLWLAGWCGGAALFWWRMRPRLVEWSIPLTLAACGWFFIAGIACWHPDTPEESTIARFTLAMFFACSGAVALAMALGATRQVLGDGHQQTASLKRLVGSVVPGFQKSPAVQKAILLRASSQPETPHDSLLRPARDTTEAPPEQLLRASRSEDP